MALDLHRQFRVLLFGTYVASIQSYSYERKKSSYESNQKEDEE